MENSINTSPSGNEQQLHSELRAIGHQLLNVAHKLMAIDAMLTFNKPDTHSPLPESPLPEAHSPKPEVIVNTVCFALNVTLAEIRSNKRNQKIADARAFISYFLIKYTRLKQVQIVKIMNLKHHTSVISHLKKVSQLQAFNKAFADKKNKIENLISKL